MRDCVTLKHANYCAIKDRVGPRYSRKYLIHYLIYLSPNLIYSVPNNMYTEEYYT